MKNKANLIGIIVIMALIVFVIVACDNGTNPCSHDWSSWVETTPASITEGLVEVNGQDSRTCSVCGEIQTQNNSVTYQSYFYGTWFNVYSEDDYDMVKISANTLEYFWYDYNISEYVLCYRMENLIWVPRANYEESEFPYGYTIKGTLTEKDDFWPRTEDGDSDAEIGDIVVDHWYIHTDKQSIDWGAWDGDEHFGFDDPFVKQP